MCLLCLGRLLLMMFFFVKMIRKANSFECEYLKTANNERKIINKMLFRVGGSDSVQMKAIDFVRMVAAWTAKKCASDNGP